MRKVWEQESVGCGLDSGSGAGIAEWVAKW